MTLEQTLKRNADLQKKLNDLTVENRQLRKRVDELAKIIRLNKKCK